MPRRKAIFRARWEGESVAVGDDIMLFMILEDDPDRMIMMSITPSLAKKLQRKLDRVLSEAGPSPTSPSAYYGYED